MHYGTAFRLANKVLRRSATEEIYLKTGLNLTRPSDIRATLTERCNYQCVYCDHWRQDDYCDEMSLHEWKQAFLSIKQFVPKFAVQFLGGEPTILTWFFDLAEFCAEEGIDWGTVTNGSSLSEGRVQRIVTARPMNIDISIDSLNANVNDFTRGVRGSMDHVKAGIVRLVAARETAGARFVIRLKPTVAKQNIACLADLVLWAATLPSVLVDLSPVNLWREDQIDQLYPLAADEVAALDEMVETLISLKRSGLPIETSEAKLRAMNRHFARQSHRPAMGMCRVGLRSLDIRPNGDVRHCWNFAPIGNLRETSMTRMWKRAERRDVVENTVNCQLFKTTCATGCLAPRTFRQEIVRGARYVFGRT